MGQLYDRINRLIKAEIDHSNYDISTGKFGEGAALIAGGAAAGASVGKIGVLAGGTGFGVGALPLAAAGALTGAALYESIKALVGEDFSSLGAAATGAVAGAGVSVAIGGVGVAAGGMAFGVGMAPMTAAGAIAGIGMAGLNRLLQQGIELEELLDLAIEEMQEDLVKFREAAISVIAAQKRMQQQYEQAQFEVDKWHQRAQIALKKGDEYLAREARVQKKIYAEAARTLKDPLDWQLTQVDRLKRKLVTFESRLTEAKANKEMFKAQIRAAKAQVQLQETIPSNSTVDEELEFFSTVDEELEFMRKQLEQL